MWSIRLLILLVLQLAWVLRWVISNKHFSRGVKLPCKRADNNTNKKFAVITNKYNSTIFEWYKTLLIFSPFVFVKLLQITRNLAGMTVSLILIITFTSLRDESHAYHFIFLTFLPVCQPWEFECASGGCVASSFICDAQIDCPDGSDEHNCSKSNKIIFPVLSLTINLWYLNPFNRDFCAYCFIIVSIFLFVYVLIHILCQSRNSVRYKSCTFYMFH